MLAQPMLEKLSDLRLEGMLSAFKEQMENKDCKSLSFEERFGLMVDREMTARENKRLTKPSPDGQAALERLRGGFGLQATPRHGQGPSDVLGFLPMDFGSRQLSDCGTHRGRQELSGLCLWPQGLPGRPSGVCT